MDLDFIFANICGRNRLFVEKPRDELVGLHSGASNIDASFCIRQVTMSLGKEKEAILLKNEANTRRVPFVHGIDAQRQGNGNLLFAVPALPAAHASYYTSRDPHQARVGNLLDSCCVRTAGDAGNGQQIENRRCHEQEKPS